MKVACHEGTKVGEFVPFYFCLRSIMLYILHKGNNLGLEYKEGQRPIVYLEADLIRVIEWADSKKRLWAFSDRNAGARYTTFYNELKVLINVDWESVNAIDFRASAVKERKQAEFLLFESLPWNLVDRICVLDSELS